MQMINFILTLQVLLCFDKTSALYISPFNRNTDYKGMCLLYLSIQIKCGIKLNVHSTKYNICIIFYNNKSVL